MRLSENRKLATIVLIVCVLGSIVLLGGGGLRNDRHDICQVFTEGTDTSLSVRHSMEAYLQRCAQSAQDLAEQAEKLSADAALIGDVRSAAEVVSDGSADLDARYDAYEQLGTAAESLYTLLERDHDESALLDARLAYDDLKGAQNLIKNDQYPAMARDFNHSLEQFPANLIAGLFGVEPLNTFGW